MKEPKKLPSIVHSDLELQNKARRLSGLPQLRITIKTCVDCGRQYESLHNRRCGCRLHLTQSIQGRELI